MQWNAFCRILVLGLLVVGTRQDDPETPDNEAQKYYKVSISGTRIELTCPLENEAIFWEKKGQRFPNENDKLLVLEDFSEVEHSGYYACHAENSPQHAENSPQHAYLYLKARVCENCMEVDLTAVAIIVIVDICFTLGFLMVVYYWSKNRKAKAKPVTRGTGAAGRPRGQNKERPPPVPNPDYEPIRKGQRDLYSGLNQRAV